MTHPEAGMETVVFLFPGTWGNDTADLVRWWFERPVAALTAVDRRVEVVPVVYRGDTFMEIVQNAAADLCAFSRPYPIRPVALCYSMGRQVFAGVNAMIEGAPFAAAAHIAGVPSQGVPLAGTLGVMRTAPWFLLRAFGGTVAPRTVEEVRDVLCSGTDAELAAELFGRMSPEPMWWKIAQMFLVGVRARTEPIPVPLFATLGTDDLIVGRADYAEDNVVTFRRPAAHHALIRKPRPDLDAIWTEQAEFLLGA